MSDRLKRGSHDRRLERAAPYVRHRWLVAAGCCWLLLVVAATAIGAAVGQRQMTLAEYAEGDSARAMSVLDQAGVEQPAGEMVLVHSDALTTDSPEFQAAVGQQGPA